MSFVAAIATASDGFASALLAKCQCSYSGIEIEFSYSPLECTSCQPCCCPEAIIAVAELATDS